MSQTKVIVHVVLNVFDDGFNFGGRSWTIQCIFCQAKPLSSLGLPKRALRPINTSPTPYARATESAYTSLAVIIPSPSSPFTESVEMPRTPMRNCLVEKAARAYLQPSDSFNRRSARNSTPWTSRLSRFLPNLSVFTMALNPFSMFSSAFNVFRFYLTGARALAPCLSVSRSMSMPVQRIAYAHI